MTEEEMAELKSFKQDCIKLTEDNVVMARQRAETARQLTKAKEIISKLLARLHNFTYTGLNCKECIEAKQFLKEIEK